VVRNSLICLKVCTLSTAKVCHGMHQPAYFLMSEENRPKRLSRRSWTAFLIQARWQSARRNPLN
jgi:hypothetical protein